MILYLLFITCLAQNAEIADDLSLHVITHSHLDAGWVYPVDRCYTTVQAIFDSVFLSLKDDNHRIYTVGDIYYFRRSVVHIFFYSFTS